MTEAAEPVIESSPCVPVAKINGQAVTDLPKDLYIPPDAMKVFLETFEGPLDFLLYLIRKQNIDVLDIPIVSVTRQYMEYIEFMKELSLELAAEYLVMAAILAEIKSRMLLPRAIDPENTEEDPRADLVRRLQDYERYKKAAEALDELPRLERDIFVIEADASQLLVDHPLPSVTLDELVQALVEALKRTALFKSHPIRLDTLSVQEKMSYILISIQNKEHDLLTNLFNKEEGRLGIVVTFLAMLELLKQHLIEFVQTAPFSPIYLKPKAA